MPTESRKESPPPALASSALAPYTRIHTGGKPPLGAFPQVDRSALARVLGVQRTTVQRVLNGRWIGKVSTVLLSDMARELGVGLEDLEQEIARVTTEH